VAFCQERRALVLVFAQLISSLLHICFSAQTVPLRCALVNSCTSTKQIARFRASPFQTDLGRATRARSSTLEASMSDSIPVHGTCDPRFTKVKELFQSSFDSGEELGVVPAS
jgi:hypothetical protein